MLDSIGEIPIHAARRFGDQTAFTIEGRGFSFAELDALSNRCANALIANGVQPGDRVTLYDGNSWQWIVSYYGALKAGAVINPVNVMLTPEEVEFVVTDCGASVLLTSLEKAQAVGELKPSGLVREILVFEGAATDGLQSFEHCLEQSSASFDLAPCDPHSLSTIGYTSGTTGHPKGACLTHRGVLLNVSMTAMMHARCPDDTVVTALPCAHVYGNVVMNGAIQNGMKLVLHRRFDPSAVMESIQQDRASMFEGVPTMYLQMLNHPGQDQYDLSSLRCCTVGGQTMPVAKMEAVEARFGCPLIELWGMTEISGLGTTFAATGPVRHGSIGVALPYVQARIVHPDDAGDVLPDGEVGELMVKGEIVMQGYYNNDAATAETIEADGWLHTGDMASMDAEGCIFIVDRKKDMILTAGYNVYPAELERVISAHADVAMVAVGSIPDEEKGELAKAYIVPKGGATPTVEDIIVFCREHLSAYKVPRAVAFVDQLPTTSTGKVMRRALATLDT